MYCHGILIKFCYCCYIKKRRTANFAKSTTRFREKPVNAKKAFGYDRITRESSKDVE